MRVSRERFRRAVSELDGHVIPTLYRRRTFIVRVAPDDSGLEYTPLATGKPRVQSWAYVDKILERYNATRSLRPRDYKEITAHASYVLALLKRVAATDALSA